MNDLISVIIPVYDVDNYLNRCVQSVIEQTYKNLEIILIDDGSPGKSPALCDEWSKKDQRIIVIHKKNGGLSSARNAGLDIAKGKYVVFVDSDDWIDPVFISVLLEQFKTKDVDIACVMFDYAYDSGFKSYEYKLKNSVLGKDKAIYYLCKGKEMTNHVWNKMYKIELFDNLFFEEKRTFEDIYIMHELFYRAKKVSTSSKTLYHYYMRQDSIIHENKPQNVADIAIGYIRRYESLEKPFSKILTLKKCAWSSYQILYLYPNSKINNYDYSIIKTFWRKHWNISLLGAKYFVMRSFPFFYKDMIKSNL